MNSMKLLLKSLYLHIGEAGELIIGLPMILASYAALWYHVALCWFYILIAPTSELRKARLNADRRYAMGMWEQELYERVCSRLDWMLRIRGAGKG